MYKWIIVSAIGLVGSFSQPAYAGGINYDGSWNWGAGGGKNSSTIDFDGIGTLRYCYEQGCWNVHYASLSNGHITFSTDGRDFFDFVDRDGKLIGQFWQPTSDRKRAPDAQIIMSKR